MIKFRDLEIINAITLSNSISGAANSLGIQQSNASKYLSSIETSYGVKLFKRDTRKLELTPLGKELMPLITDCLKKRDELMAVLGHYKSIQAETVVIYAQRNILRYLTQNVIHKLKKINKTILILKVYEQDTIHLFPDDGDIIISHVPLRVHSANMIKLISYDYAAFASTSNLPKFTNDDGAISVIAHPLIEKFKARIDSHCDKKLAWKYDCEDFMSAVNLARKGLGVLFAPCNFFQAGLRNVVLFRGKDNCLSLDSGMFLMCKTQQSKQVGDFISELSKIIKETPSHFFYKI